MSSQSQMPPIRIWAARVDARIPEIQTSGAAGVDLHAAPDDGASVVLAPGDRRLIGTGLHMAIPDGWEMQIRPRSGLAFKHGITVLNTPGTVDSDYRGEIRILLCNFGPHQVVIRPGDRIAQAVFMPVWRPTFITVAAEADLGETDRGSGGFGSTGT